MESDKKERPGHRAPEGYDASKYDRPSVATDIVIMAYRESRLEVLLIQRKNDPYKGQWALPGGFVEMDESVETSAQREAKEETGMSDLKLIQVGVFGSPDRDPRTRVISSAFMTLVRPYKAKARAGDDAASVGWFPVKRPPELAFDHKEIILKSRERLREIAVLTPRLFDLLPRKFSRDDFRQLCREVMGRRYDAGGFYESMRRNPGFIQEGTGPSGEVYYHYDQTQYQMGDFMFLLLGD